MRLLSYFLMLPLLAAETKQVRLLSTTDMHGWLIGYDYYAGKPANRGLSKIATLIRQARAEQPATVLLDCGDTIQGSPLEAVHQIAFRANKSNLPDPMMTAMNALGYDAMAMGNHEFNFGLKNLYAARAVAKFPWLSANIVGVAGTATFVPYTIKTVNDLRIGIIGLTTGAIPEWEKPENYKGYRWIGQLQAARERMIELREQRVDAIVIAVHGGLDRDLKTNIIRPGEMPNDNMVYQLATGLSDVDVIFYGHSHLTNEGTNVGNTLIVQARNWGQSLAQVDLDFERTPNGWKLTNKKSKLIPVTESTPDDPEIEKIAKPYHEAAERYLNTPVATSSIAMSGSRARIEDTPLIDAVHEAQLYYAKADVSFTALFNPGARIKPGPVTVREMAALYIYDNELYAVEGNGKMVREALENAARYYLSCREVTCAGPLTNPNVPGFNFDMAQGVSYVIDLTKPAGQRIENLTYKGAPLKDDQPLRLAINNYRSGGSAGYTMFRDAKILWRSGKEIRELLIDYYTEKKQLPAKADNNWHLVPSTAVATLEAEIAASAATRR
jgi:2',3'-cyclic-nucleotide 2'-phosphodiesterase/3'-nucleotidase